MHGQQNIKIFFPLFPSPYPLRLLLPITCAITFSHSILTLKLPNLSLVYRPGTSVYRKFQKKGGHILKLKHKCTDGLWEQPDSH